MRDASPPESSRPSEPALARALALARDALSVAPAGLLTDIDGTLSPIVSDPASARLAEGAAEALERLVDRLAVVAIITGRGPLDARRMTGVRGLLVAGTHGTEWLEPGDEAPSPSPEADRVRPLLRDVLERVPARPGVTVEDKGLSATVHYRRAPDPEAARAAVVAAIGDLPAGLERRDGRMSLELRPVGVGDKGAAARSVIERYGLRGIVAMGDDVTDLDMFAAVADARAAGRVRGALIAVGGSDREVPAMVAEAADVVVPSVKGAAALLRGLAGPDR